MKKIKIFSKEKEKYIGDVIGIKTPSGTFTLSNSIISKNCDLPDIDMDFEDKERHRVREHVQELYGENNVAGISTFLSIKGRGSFRDVCRVFDIQTREVNEISKLLDDDQDLTPEIFENSEFEEVRSFYEKYPKIIDFTCRLQHVIRGYGQHAAGVCISNTDLRDGTKCSLVKRRQEIVCNWDKDDAEYMGLVKMDFLGLSALSRIHECLDLIEETCSEKIVLEDLDFEDPNIYKMIDDGDTAGIFQLGTYGITKLCKNLGISEFQNLYNATALYRPGPLGSGMTEEFVARKNGKKYTHICREMKEITKDTYGIILYQEQVMFACNKLAGISWGRCDKIRKLMAKSKGVEALQPFKEEFVDGCLKNTKLAEKQAVKLWDQLAEIGKYGFNKCLDPNTTFVRTKNNGTISIKDVLVGTFIDTPEGFCRIKSKHRNGEREVFSFKFSNNQNIVCTPNHKFLCSDNEKHTALWIFMGGLDVVDKNNNLCKIIDYHRAGIIETMDLEMDNKSHTFYANGIATSNSHSVEYTFISFWDAWLKYYYPYQFFASYLTFAGDDKKKQLMQDVVKRGIGIQLPKVGISKATRWQVDGFLLVMPFSEIVGIGESRAIQIEESAKRKRTGFFGNQGLAIPNSAQKILQDIKAFDKTYEFKYKELKTLQNYFIYDLTNIFYNED